MLEKRYETAFELYPYEKGAYLTEPVSRHPVVIVGCGPIGLALALDLGKKDVPVLLLDDHEGAGLGSKAICFSKRTLDIANRLNVSEAMIDKGVTWNVGKVFHADDKLFEFNLLPEVDHQNPAFINLQQPYFEKCLFDGIVKAQEEGAPIKVRGANRVNDIHIHDDYVSLDVSTPDGAYQIEADWLFACDGARSPIRDMMGLTFDGRVFEDNFLIADVKMKADFPAERWFWFEPPFENSGQSALLHKQPDDVWRIDFQLGWDINREKELCETNIRARVDAMLSSQTGSIPDYELEWTSIYTFQCRRMKNFRHGRVFFAGDSAHQVSPFGARGANSGLQDAENIAWKLDLVMKGLAPDCLLDSYSAEREFGADENILNSTRATDFLTPKSEVSCLFRDAVLSLAKDYEFTQPLVNSGRLSVPCIYDDFPHFGTDELKEPLQSRPGASCPDARVEGGFLLQKLTGDFIVLTISGVQIELGTYEGIVVKSVHVEEPSGSLKERYLGEHTKAVYLIRPDQHVVARWVSTDQSLIKQALLKAIGRV